MLQNVYKTAHNTETEYGICWKKWKDEKELWMHIFFMICSRTRENVTFNMSRKQQCWMFCKMKLRVENETLKEKKGVSEKNWFTVFSLQCLYMLYILYFFGCALALCTFLNTVYNVHIYVCVQSDGRMASGAVCNWQRRWWDWNEANFIFMDP